MSTYESSRRMFLRQALAGAAALALHQLPGSTAAAAASPPPNIVFIYIDDMGWRDAACLGSKYYVTPNIDRLAKQSMMFTQAYACAPNCAPSRACLLSGQYTPRHGVYTVNSSERGEAKDRKVIPTPNKRVLSPNIVTFAEALKPAGYTMASIGKWHLGADPESGPVAQGFDVNVGGGAAGNPGTYFSPYRTKGVTDGPPGEYLTDRLTDEAITFIRDNKQRPFMLYLSHYAVHTPIQAKKELIAKYEGREPDGGHKSPAYAAMLDSTDQSVGRILDALDELGLSENTMVVFYSDNGGFGPITSMAPLRGAKGTIHEGGIRVPLLVRWPGKVAPGSVCDVPVIGVDFYPTFLELAGAAPPDQPLDGISLIPLLTGGQPPQRDALYWHEPVYLDPNLPEDGMWRVTPCTAIRGGDWKLVAYYEDDRVELYNLKDDVSERDNLAETLPEKAAELRAKLDAWRKKMNVPDTLPPNPQYQRRRENPSAATTNP